MNYQEYLEMTANTPFNHSLMWAMFNEAQASGEKLGQILDVFLSLTVPEDFDGDMSEVYEDAVNEIVSGENGEEMVEYAEMIWSLDPGVSNSVFNVLEQFT